jgi:fatty-acyl-CoA synthase
MNCVLQGFEWLLPLDEWETQAINYTSGTTGRPKGVCYSHRGAALNGMNQALVWGMPQHPTYLWTLPMFHCNGWTFPGTVTLMGGTHVCLRAVDAPSIFGAIERANVSHLCGAPIVMNMLVNAPPPLQRALTHRKDPTLPPVKMFTAGAPPPASVIAGMEQLGVDVTHVYGLTETYGPVVLSPWKEELWGNKPASEKALLKARQGVTYPLNELCVLGDDGQRVPQDGTTIGEIVLRGNIVMKGRFTS